jgi:Ca2+/Na+ antiporter
MLAGYAEHAVYLSRLAMMSMLDVLSGNVCNVAICLGVIYIRSMLAIPDGYADKAGWLSRLAILKLYAAYAG